MNFQEWYKFGTPEEQGCFMGDAEMGWEACKKEVLKILKENIVDTKSRGDVILFSSIEEIEKL